MAVLLKGLGVNKMIVSRENQIDTGFRVGFQGPFVTANVGRDQTLEKPLWRLVLNQNPKAVAGRILKRVLYVVQLLFRDKSQFDGPGPHGSQAHHI